MGRGIIIRTQYVIRHYTQLCTFRNLYSNAALTQKQPCEDQRALLAPFSIQCWPQGRVTGIWKGLNGQELWFKGPLAWIMSSMSPFLADRNADKHTNNQMRDCEAVVVKLDPNPCSLFFASNSERYCTMTKQAKCKASSFVQRNPHLFRLVQLVTDLHQLHV